MNSNSIVRAWTTLCPPAQIYPIVMAAVILFNLYRGTYRYAIHYVVATIVGTTFLWILCAANLEFAAYALLLMPILFFVFLLALIFYDQTLFEIHSNASAEKRRRDRDRACEKACECATADCECERDECAVA
jgi:hypothetical protein